MDLHWSLLMWYSSLPTVQPVTFSWIICLTETWYHTLTILLTNFPSSILSWLLYPCKANWMKLTKKLTIKFWMRCVIYEMLLPSSELSIIKNINTLLSNKLAALERRFWENAQYSRRECVGIKGILWKVSEKVVEENILNISDKIGCSIFSYHIESCHRISQKCDTVIVKFSWQKNCQQVW